MKNFKVQHLFLTILQSKTGSSICLIHFLICRFILDPPRHLKIQIPIPRKPFFYHHCINKFRKYVLWCLIYWNFIFETKCIQSCQMDLKWLEFQPHIYMICRFVDSRCCQKFCFLLLRTNDETILISNPFCVDIGRSDWFLCVFRMFSLGSIRISIALCQHFIHFCLLLVFAFRIFRGFFSEQFHNFLFPNWNGNENEKAKKRTNNAS